MTNAQSSVASSSAGGRSDGSHRVFSAVKATSTCAGCTSRARLRRWKWSSFRMLRARRRMLCFRAESSATTAALNEPVDWGARARSTSSVETTHCSAGRPPSSRASPARRRADPRHPRRARRARAARDGGRVPDSAGSAGAGGVERTVGGRGDGELRRRGEPADGRRRRAQRAQRAPLPRLARIARDGDRAGGGAARGGPPASRRAWASRGARSPGSPRTTAGTPGGRRRVDRLGLLRHEEEIDRAARAPASARESACPTSSSPVSALRAGN